MKTARAPQAAAELWGSRLKAERVGRRQEEEKHILLKFVDEVGHA